MTNVALKTGGSLPPFFCVHALDGGVDGFRLLAEKLSPERPFYGIRSPSLDGDLSDIESMEALAAHYVDEMCAIQPQGPYFIGGYSMGGRVAFAMAHRLKELDQKVGLLVLLDSRSYIGRRLPRPKERLARYARVLRKASFKGKIEFIKTQIDRRRNKFSGHIVNKRYAKDLADYEQTGNPPPPGVGLTTYINYRINLAYKARPFGGPALLIKVDRSFLHPDVHDGWRTMLPGDFREYTAAGRHLTILKEPDVDEIARVLGEALQEPAGQSRPETPQSNK